MRRAHELDKSVKDRNSSELNGAFGIYRSFNALRREFSFRAQALCPKRCVSAGGLEGGGEEDVALPCPKNQCVHPEAVKVLVLPHTLGANRFKVVPGVPFEEQAADDLLEYFKDVHFPDERCYEWHVKAL